MAGPGRTTGREIVKEYGREELAPGKRAETTDLARGLSEELPQGPLFLDEPHLFLGESPVAAREGLKDLAGPSDPFSALLKRWRSSGGDNGHLKAVGGPALAALGLTIAENVPVTGAILAAVGVLATGLGFLAGIFSGKDGEDPIDIRQVFAASDAEYLAKNLATRQPGAEGSGSRFDSPITLEKLAAADWVPYEHPDVQPPAIAFRAAIPGRVGVVSLESLDPEASVILRDRKGTGFLEAEFPMALGPQVEHTTLLVGPDRDDPSKLTVWTFFPGDPVMPSRLEVSENHRDGMRITVREALASGMAFVKAVEGDAPPSETKQAWVVGDEFEQFGFSDVIVDPKTGLVREFLSDIEDSSLAVRDWELAEMARPFIEAGVNVDYRGWEAVINKEGYAEDSNGTLLIGKDDLNRAIAEGRLAIKVDDEGKLQVVQDLAQTALPASPNIRKLSRQAFEDRLREGDGGFEYQMPSRPLTITETVSYEGLFVHPGDGTHAKTRYENMITTRGAEVMVTTVAIKNTVGSLGRDAESPGEIIGYRIFGSRGEDDLYGGGFFVMTADRRIVEEIHMEVVRHIEDGLTISDAYGMIQENAQWADLMMWGG